MKKIQVNHTPNFMKGVAIALSFLWVFFIFYVCYFIPKFATLLSIGLLLLIIGISSFIDNRKTNVEYGAEKIHWKWLWIDYTANFSEIKFVHYTIIHEQRRYGGYNHRFEIVFNLKNGTTLRLNDSLALEDIDNCIDGNTDNIKLMQLYRFIEKFYPEKTIGFY